MRTSLPDFTTAPGLQTTAVTPRFIYHQYELQSQRSLTYFLTVQQKQMSLESFSQTHYQFEAFGEIFRLYGRVSSSFACTQQTKTK